MTEEEIYQQIKSALLAAPRKQYMVEMHLQMLKYADEHTLTKAIESRQALNDSF